MSAFIVGRDHIEYLVGAGLHMQSSISNHQRTWGFEGEWITLTVESATKVGQMLWDANIASVQARYPGEKISRLPGTADDSYEYKHVGRWHARYEPIQVIKAIHCLDYQSCEHEGWKASEARAFLEMLKGEAIRELPGYDKAEWGPPKA